MDGQTERQQRRVKEHIQQENAHNLDGVVATLAPTVFLDDAPWDEHHQGPAAVRQYYLELFRASPDFHLEVKSLHGTPDAVFVEVQVDGSHGGPWHGLPATGRRFSISSCAIFTFDEEDRIAGERIYYDRMQVLSQIGVLSDPASLRGKLGAMLLHPINVGRALVGLPVHARA